MAFVFLFIFLSVFVTLMLPVRVSMSAKTGTAPKYKAAFPVAAKVSAGTTTSSPLATPAAKYAAWSAAVPELTATAYFVPAALASAFSNRSTAGPWVSHPECRALPTAFTSASLMSWVEYGIMRQLLHKKLLRLFLVQKEFLVVARVEEPFGGRAIAGE